MNLTKISQYSIKPLPLHQNLKAMKKTKLFFKTLMLVVLSNSLFSQRYLTEVFADVTVTDNVVYGQNISIITGSPVLNDLKMTVYEPTGDSIDKRPLIIFLPTGNFLPKTLNQTPVGTRSDSTVVEICSRLAKMGYVCAAITYRLGWSPIDPVVDNRTGSLLRAVYRAIQDTRTSIRFFRKDAFSNGNNYDIDPWRIAVMGEGSGGYVALATSTLDEVSEIQLTKFYDFTNNVPYVDPNFLGDFDGFGGNSTYNHENHPGYNSNVVFCANIGGALGDSSWLEAGDVPMVSFHCVSDPYAPYGDGDVIVPTTGDFVVSVSGSHTVQMRANAFGNNDVFGSPTDPFSVRANMVNDGYEGLFPFVTPNVQSAPWQWWNSSEQMNANGLATNPDMSRSKAMTYIDTIIGYLSPRLKSVMVDDTTIGISETNIIKNNVVVYPNPSSSNLFINADNMIQSIRLFSMTGQEVLNIQNVNSNKFEVLRSSIKDGLYFISIATSKGQITQKIILQ